MKLAIIGGSAPSTAALFLTPEFRALHSDLRITLIGRSPERLEAIARAVRMLCGEAARIECATDYAAVDGAAIVLLQARYGGYDARIRDETFPLRYGACGDEGLGAGGLAAAWRSWPEIRKALAAVAERSPNARVFIMTAPLGLLVRCARQAFETLDIAGICELPWTTLKDACGSLGRSATEVQFSYAGVNHLGWFDELRFRGVDLIGQYARTRRGSAFPRAEIIDALRAIPLKYFALHYDGAGVLREQRQRVTRAAELRAIQASTSRALAVGSAAEIIDALAARATPWYTDAIAPLVAGALTGSASTVFFLSAPNRAYVPSLREDDVLEQPFVLNNSSLHRLERSKELSPALLTTLSGFVAYERAAADALLHGSVMSCGAVLARHPWYRNHPRLEGLAAAVIAAV